MKEEKQKDQEVRPGRYLHYKGKFYEVIGVGHHSEILKN